MAHQLTVTSVSMMREEKKEMQQAARALRMTVSQFIRGLVRAYLDAKAEPIHSPTVERREETLALLRQGKTYAEVMEQTGMSESYIQKLSREFGIKPPNKDRLTVETICSIIQALQTTEDTYETIAQNHRVSMSALHNLVPKAQKVGLIRKRKVWRKYD